MTFRMIHVSPTALVANLNAIGEGSKVEHGVVIEDRVRIGRDCFIGYYAIIRPGTVIGNKSEVRSNCYIAEDVTIGNQSHVFQYTNVGKGTVIEDCVWIGAKVMITNTKNIAHLRDFETELFPCTIKHGARIASCVQINPGVTIGENAVIGAGAVVTKNVPNGEKWFGNPATYQGKVPDNELI